MPFAEKNIREIRESAVSLISDEWMLVSAGDQTGYNMMTASWGGLGEMWGKDVAIAVIRPQRYTYEFMEKAEGYTLSFYGEEGKKAVHAVCGSKSGREVDKTALTGLTPVFDGPYTYFEQARLVLCCKKVYVQDIDPACFTDPSLLEKWYQNDYHRAYVGAIEKVLVRA